MKLYAKPALDIIWVTSERNCCVSFDNDDNTEIWTVEDEETL